VIEVYSAVKIRHSAHIKEKFDKFNCLLSTGPCAKKTWKSQMDVPIPGKETSHGF
jgi:hypothetical protein